MNIEQGQFEIDALNKQKQDTLIQENLNNILHLCQYSTYKFPRDFLINENILNAPIVTATTWGSGGSAPSPDGRGLRATSGYSQKIARLLDTSEYPGAEVMFWHVPVFRFDRYGDPVIEMWQKSECHIHTKE